MLLSRLYDILMETGGNILSIDLGTSYVGLAYRNEKSDMIMPIGYIMNDKSLFFNMSDILSRYFIKHIIIGYPKQHKKMQAKIDDFLQSLTFIDPDIPVEKVDEEYSSVVANATTDTYTKDEKEDTLAAMVILETYIQNL